MSILGLAVVVLEITIAFTVAGGLVFHRADTEQVVGIAALGAVVLAIGVTVAMIFIDAAPSSLRVLLSLASFGIALFFASRNWRRRSLRTAAAMAMLLVGFMILSIGRSALSQQFRADAIMEIARAQTVVDQLAGQDAAATSSAARSRFDDSLGKACWVADRYPPDDPPANVGDPNALPAELTCEPRATEDSLAVALALMRWRLAQYQSAVLNRPEDQAAVQAAASDVFAARAGSPTSGASPPSFADALREGAGQVVQDLPGQSEPELILQVAGWVLLAALILGFWRIVERRAAEQLPGPVTVSLNVAKSPRTGVADDPRAKKSASTAAPSREVASTAPTSGIPKSGNVTSAESHRVGTDPDAQLADFRAALLVNLKEPGAVPGAHALRPLTDLIELPGVAASWLKPIVTAISSVLSVSQGYNVIGEVVPPDTNDGDWIVLVRIVDTATGDQVGVTTINCASDVQACRAGGYWAAATILARSGRIASWARWDEDTADALATYDNRKQCELRDLELAIAQAPSSGVLLLILAARYNLASRFLDALSLSARAVAAHPRYPVGRYRLAVSLGMLGLDIGEQWMSASSGERKRVVAQLARACRAIGIKDPRPNLHTLVDEPTDWPTYKETSEATFRNLATMMFDILRKDTSLWGTTVRAFRRSERDSWWLPGLAKFGEAGPRRRSRYLARSASLVYGCAGGRADRARRRMMNLAAKPGSDWQICYNLACYYSRRSHVEEALTWLETALERPGSGQMGRDWLEVDPDLAKIRGTVRFRWIADQLRSPDNSGVRDARRTR